MEVKTLEIQMEMQMEVQVEVEVKTKEIRMEMQMEVYTDKHQPSIGNPWWIIPLRAEWVGHFWMMNEPSLQWMDNGGCMSECLKSRG